MDLITAFKDEGEAAISESVARYVTASHGADSGSSRCQNQRRAAQQMKGMDFPEQGRRMRR